MEKTTKYIALALAGLLLVGLLISTAVLSGRPSADEQQRALDQAKATAEAQVRSEEAVKVAQAQLAEKQKAEELAKAQAELEAKKAAEAEQARILEETKKKLAEAEAEKQAAQEASMASPYKAYFEDSSDILEVGELLGAVKDAVTKTELKTLVGGRISTSRGTTDYNQYLMFEQSSGMVLFGENDDDVVGDYLFFEADEPVFEFQLEFPSGLESDVDDGMLQDLDGRKVNILGREYTFVNSRYDSGSDVMTLELLSGDDIVTLREGESITVLVGDREHSVTLAFVSDPNNGETEAKITVDGETTQALGVGETDLLDNGLEVGVSEILVNGRDAIVKMFFGAHKIVLEDKITDASYSNGVEVDRESINYVDIQIKGSEDGNKVRVHSIKYLVNADALDGSDIYVAPGKGLREFIRRPLGLLSDKFDIRYDGLAKSDETTFAIKPSGDSEYRLDFVNRKGQHYSIDYVSAKDGNFKYGTDDEELWFVEAASSGTFAIERKDSVVLTDVASDKGYTAVLSYDDIDTTDKILTFHDLADNGDDISVSYSGVEGAGAVGDLIVNGKTFKVYVGGGPDYKLAIDLTSDGNVDGTHAPVVIMGGGIYHMGPAQPIIGSSFTTELVTLEKNLDTAGGDEVVEFEISKVNTDEVALDILSGVSLFNGDGDDELGITSYGAIIKLKDNDNNPDALEISYPASQRKAVAYVTISE